MYENINAWARTLPSKIYVAIDRSYSLSHYLSRGIRILGSLMLFTMLATHLIFAPSISLFDTFSYLLIGLSLLGFFITTRNPISTRRSLTLWATILFINIPLAQSLLLFSHANGPSVSEALQMFWVLQYTVALFFFTQLCGNWALSTFGMLIGFGLAFSANLFLPEANPTQLQNMVIDPFGAYLTIVFLVGIINQTPWIVSAERRYVTRAVGGSIAGEMRQPLESIAVNARLAGTVLPRLLEEYESAQEDGSVRQKHTPRQLQLFRESTKDIEQEAEHAQTLIDILQVNTADQPTFGQGLETFSAVELVHEAVHRFPFSSSSERNVVSERLDEDFVITAPKLLLVHVLFNLIKNALYYVHKGIHEPEITISVVSTGSEQGVIKIRDNGPGISQSDMARVFERFYSTTETGRGSGIGLDFCSEVMQKIGGVIRVRSELGQHTEFILEFTDLPKPEISAR